MDNFRWILLAVGVLIVGIIYLISRKNRRDFYKEDDYPSEDLPDINTRNWDDLDEGVGEVRIVARNNDYQPPGPGASSSAAHPDSVRREPVELDEDDENDPLFAKWPKTVPATEETVTRPAPESGPEPETEPEPEPAAEPEGAESPGYQAEPEPETEPREAVLVLNILARDGSALSGDSINSVARANNMVFGDMSIYHRMDAKNEPVFSLVNMVKPGIFDPATIHELSTPGISLFMQLPGPDNPGAAYDDMLQTAYRISETLEARLCDRKRQPLTQSVADEYRSLAASFNGKA